MRLSFIATLSLLAGGCYAAADGATGDSFQDEDIPMGMCPGTDCPETDEEGGPDSGAAAGDPCDDTGQCAAGFCAAPFDGNEPGELVCQTVCIELEDDSMWCSDDAACCDSNAVCTPRGYCVAGGSVDGTGSDGTTGDGDTTNGDTTAGDTDGTESSSDSAGESSGSSGGTASSTGM